MREAIKALTCGVNFIAFTIAIYGIYGELTGHNDDDGVSALLGFLTLVNIIYIFVTEKPKPPRIKPVRQWYLSLWFKRKRLEEEFRIKELESKK